MEDDLKILKNGRRPQFFSKMEDNLNSFQNGRQLQLFQLKTTSKIILEYIELNQTHYKFKQNGCGIVPGNLVISIAICFIYFKSFKLFDQILPMKISYKLKEKNMKLSNI